MNFFTAIRQWFIFATNVLIDWALFFYGYGGIGEWIGDLCRDLSDFTSAVAGYLWDAANWWNEVTPAIAGILSWDTIKSLILSWLPNLELALAWFGNWWANVRANIESWWQITISTVQAMIDLATQGFSELVAAWDNFTKVTLPGVLGELDGLWAAWSNFWEVTFPTLVSFTWLAAWWTARVKDVQGLIDTAFTLRESLWAGWQDWRDEVAEFFSDPEDWLYKAFYRIVERFW